jgi:hypothetical protein
MRFSCGILGKLMPRRLPILTTPTLRRRCLFALAVLAFLAALSNVPYHFPIEPNFSESYLFGYNNRAGMAIVTLGLVLLALFGPHLHLQPPTPGKPLTRRTLTKALAVSFAVSTVLYLLTHSLNGFNESIYLIDRVKMLLDGRTPYRQFEFAYGALFLYLPAWLARLLHLSASDAYGLFWVLTTVLGTWLLYYVVQNIDEPPGRQRLLFLLFWYLSMAALPSLGTNCGTLRFILPGAFAILLYKRLARTPQTQPLTLLLPLPMYALLLAVSPELAIAFALGILFYLALFGHLRIAQNLIACLTTLAGMAALTLLAARFGVFTTLQVFSAGGLNFPIMPAPHMLLLYTFAGLCACYAGQRLRERSPSALLLLIFVSAAALAGALGRCDPFHTLMDPFGIVLAAGFLLTRLPVRRLVWPVAVAVYLVFPLLVTVPYNGTNFARAALPLYLAHEPATPTRFDRWIIARMARSMPAPLAQEKFLSLKHFSRRTGPIDVPALFGLPEATVFAAPFGFAPSHFGLYHSPAIDEGFYAETVNIATPAGIQQLIAELAAHPSRPLLMLPGREGNCGSGPVAALTYLRQTFLYPYTAPAVHPASIGEPLCTYIQHHYIRTKPATPATFDYELWSPLAPPQEQK